MIAEVEPLPEGGTLSVRLGSHALRRGYAATIYTYNLALFDPTWFPARGEDLAERLRAQAAAKRDPKLRAATGAYLDYLALGGRVRFQELGGGLIRRFLRRGQPILAGLSATYLYGCAREAGDRELVYDDVRGSPVGHFVVLYAWDPSTRRVHVADPYGENPAFERHHYAVSVDRIVGAILLGVLSYDANLLVLEPPGKDA